MKKQIGMLFLAGWFAMGSVKAQDSGGDGREYSLKECIEMGLQFNTEIKKTRLNERAALHQRREIIGSGLPQLRGYGNYNNFLDIYPQGLPGGLFDPNSDPNSIDVIAFGVPQSVKAGFELTQLVYSQSYLVGLRAAKSSEEFYSLLTGMKEDDIIYDISLNYYGVIATILQMDNLRANHEKLSRLKDILKVQYENDLARKVDYNRVLVNLTTLETEIDNLDILVEQRTNYLKLIMGLPIHEPLELEPYDFSHIKEESYKVQADVAYDPHDRYDIRVIGKRMELNELNVKNIQSGYYPTLAAFADVNYNAFSNSFDFMTSSHRWYRGSLIGLQLNVPIFDGFQRKNKVAQAKIESELLQQDHFFAEQAAWSEYQNAIKKMANSLKGLRTQESNLELSEQVFSETESLYKEGLSPLTDLLDTETALREARSAYYNQIINVKTAQADLYKSMGQTRKIIQ